MLVTFSRKENINYTVKCKECGHEENAHTKGIKEECFCSECGAFQRGISLNFCDNCGKQMGKTISLEQFLEKKSDQAKALNIPWLNFKIKKWEAK